MDIYYKMVKRPSKVIPKTFDNNSYLTNRIGFWGTVIDVNSLINAVTVRADTGLEYKNIPVATKTWVNKTDNFVSGERDLPQVGSRVFVLTPTKTIQGAFVLCSGYARGEKDTHNLYCKKESDKTKFNTSMEKITQSGWKLSENFTTGYVEVKSKDDNVNLSIDLEENEIVISAWNHSITLSKDGIEIKSNTDLTIDAGSHNLNLKGQKVSINGTNLEVT